MTNNLIGNSAYPSGKIALMTWYTYSNYGSVLQAYALSKVLREKGFVVDFVKYDPQKNKQEHEPYTFSSFISGILNSFKEVGTQPNKSSFLEEREKKYQSFRDSFVTETREVLYSHELFGLTRQYDAFVCGSDQIWSPLCFDPSYFLNFVSDPEKKIAYAPSIGKGDIADPRMKDWYRELLKNFKYLSVRELDGAELVESLTGKRCETVIDPTMLLEWNDWQKIANYDLVPSESYCLCYFLGTNKRNWSLAKKIAKSYGLRLLIIPVFKEDFEAEESVSTPVGPRDFVGLIDKASFVCTDSFHGMLFSVNAHTPFAVFNRFSYKDPKCQNSRIDSFLSISGLNDRRITREKDLDRILSNNTNQDSFSRVSEFKEKSLEYLDKALLGALSSKDDKSFSITNTCISCGACSACCPSGAIENVTDENGYKSALINSSKCINCQKCVKVCPFSGRTYEPFESKKIKNYSFCANEEIRESSSSGGFAAVLSSVASKKGLDIWGCSYDYTKNSAIHICASPENEQVINSFKGSKYIHSESWDAFSSIITDKSSSGVFIGTPCQIAALRNLLGRSSEDWLLVDLICHGVPTDLIWEQNIKRLQNLTNTSSFTSIKFRDKKKGWRTLLFSIYDEENKCLYSQDEDHDPYMRIYTTGIFDYESCKECPFRITSKADIRIGDYWGPWFSANHEGVSEVIVISEKGKKWLEYIAEMEEAEIEERPFDEYFIGQGINKEREVTRSLDRFEKVRNINKVFSVSFKQFADYCCRNREKRARQDRILRPFVIIYRKILGK